MLNISSSQPVGWPTAPPVSTGLVHAVPSVGAAQSASREASADDQGQQGQRPAGPAPVVSARQGSEKTSSTPEVKAAPLLPRGSDKAVKSVADQAAQDRAENEQHQKEAQKARDKAEQQLQLKEVLTKVWKASAAVVEVVLGRDDPASQVAAAEAASVPAVSSSASAFASASSGTDRVEATTLASEVGRTPDATVQAELPGMEPVPVAALRRDQEPTSYTEQGASSWAPFEAGILINQRV